MRTFLILTLLSSPAFATQDYTRQLNLPCGLCHVIATGAGHECLGGKWDKMRGTWATPPKPMVECSFSPGGALTPYGQTFKDNEHTLK